MLFQALVSWKAIGTFAVLSAFVLFSTLAIVLMIPKGGNEK